MVHTFYGQIRQKIITVNANSYTKGIVSLYTIYGQIRQKRLGQKSFWGKFFGGQKIKSLTPKIIGATK